MINWFEIPSLDLQRAIQFYETILEIRIQVQDFGTFQMGFFPSDEAGGVSGALMAYPAEYIPSESDGPLLYLNGGEDIQFALDKVELAGGKIVKPKTIISPENGYMALIIDTEGNRLALHSMH